jgi:hypothetical protein
MSSRSWYFGIPYGEVQVRRAFGVPADRNVIGVVALGHPGVDERPRGSAYSLTRRPLDDMVHHNGW